ncbi:MAG: PEP/pyruvate-binding domain-containing protein [Nanobdellota archaeon]
MNQTEVNKGDSNEKPELIKWFSELGKDFGNIAGEKGANLAEMYNLKAPVPPGFVITSQAYEYFIENSGIKNLINGQLGKINYEDTRLLNDIAEVIRNNIIEAKMPLDMEEEIIEAYENLSASDLSEVYGSALDILQNAHEPLFVAVRSSSTTEDLAEKQESFLNIKGNQQLIVHIKKCFASLFTPKAIMERKMRGYPDFPKNIAVIVQKMVDSEKSGLIFSRNPENGEDNLVIEAIWGLGEGISSGTINPDVYFVNKNMEILGINIADKEIAITRDSSGEKSTVKLREEKSKYQVLTKNEIRKLSELTIQIEEYYQQPQIIEFAIEGGNIYLVQVSPLKNVETNKESNIEEITLKEETEFEKETQEVSNEEIKPATVKTKTKIKLIVDLPTLAERASKTGLTSVGLTRIEWIIAESGKHINHFLEKGNTRDYEEIIFKGVNEIAKYFDEIWIRTSDIRSDEFTSLEGAPKEKEANPLLGLHGIRFGLKNPKILLAELNALKRVSESGKKIGIIIPQVILVEEVQKVKEILNEIEFTNAKLGVMVETPAAVQMISQLCNEGISFISFETSDLTQYMLAVDKESETVQNLYNEMNPAILYQIEYVIRVCKRKNVETNICSKIGNNKEMIRFLVEKGIDSISVNADAVNEIANYVKQLEEELIKGTDKEPRMYNPKENRDGEPVHINGIEKLQEHQD